jgi:hypothetical protein
MLDVYTIKGSCVIPKIAGTESKAKTISLNSIQTRHKNNGVASDMPLTEVKNL